MRKHFIISFFLPIWLWAAPEWLLIRTVDGTQTEGQAQLCSVKIESEGKLVELRLSQILSVHNAAPASKFEAGRITAGLAAIQAPDRKTRDLAVEELTAIGLPAMTPLLQMLKDTDPGRLPCPGQRSADWRSGRNSCGDPRRSTRFGIVRKSSIWTPVSH